MLWATGLTWWIGSAFWMNRGTHDATNTLHWLRRKSLPAQDIVRFSISHQHSCKCKFIRTAIFNPKASLPHRHSAQPVSRETSFHCSIMHRDVKSRQAIPARRTFVSSTPQHRSSDCVTESDKIFVAHWSTAQGCGTHLDNQGCGIIAHHTNQKDSSDSDVSSDSFGNAQFLF